MTKLKRCAHPKCDRLFVERGNKIYCTHRCASSVTTTRNRDRYREKFREYQRTYALLNAEKIKEKQRRTYAIRAAKIKAADQILKWAKEQGVYNG